MKTLAYPFPIDFQDLGIIWRLDLYVEGLNAMVRSDQQ